MKNKKLSCIGIVFLFLIIVLGGLFAAYAEFGLHPAIVGYVAQRSWQQTHDFEAQIEGKFDISWLLGDRHTVKIRFCRPELWEVQAGGLRLIAGKESLWAISESMKAAVRITGKDLTPVQLLKKIIAQLGATQIDEITHDLKSQNDARLLPFEARRHPGKKAAWVLSWPDDQAGQRQLWLSRFTAIPRYYLQLDARGQEINRLEVTRFIRNTGLVAGDFEYEAPEGYVLLTYRYDPSQPFDLLDILRGKGDVVRDEARKLLQKYGKDLPQGIGDWLGL